MFMYEYIFTLFWSWRGWCVFLWCVLSRYALSEHVLSRHVLSGSGPFCDVCYRDVRYRDTRLFPDMYYRNIHYRDMCYREVNHFMMFIIGLSRFFWYSLSGKCSFCFVRYRDMCIDNFIKFRLLLVVSAMVLCANGTLP